MNSLDRELRKDMLRGRLAPYTRRAYQMLPGLVDPFILDIDCHTQRIVKDCSGRKLNTPSSLQKETVGNATMPQRTFLLPFFGVCEPNRVTVQI
jgi:hypothetical protein